MPDQHTPATCIFCDIINGRAPARFVPGWGPNTSPVDVVAFTPLSPVTGGHVLIVPAVHVETAATDPEITARVFAAAAVYAAAQGFEFNLLTSAGRAATQSVDHLHVHYVPRFVDDGLMLPWGTLHGEDPKAPHNCRGMVALQTGIDALAREIDVSCVAPHTPSDVVLGEAWGKDPAPHRCRQLAALEQQLDGWAERITTASERSNADDPCAAERICDEVATEMRAATS